MLALALAFLALAPLARAALYHGRVVATETRQPIAGAVVSLEDGRIVFVRVSHGKQPPQPGKVRATVVADERGAFAIDVPPDVRSWLRIEAPGAGPVFVPAHGHATAEDAFTIEMPRAARLDAHVVDAAPGDKVVARVIAPDMTRPAHASIQGARFEREAVLGDDLVAHLVDLPPEATIELELVAKNGAQRAVREDFVLAPGEARAVELTVPGFGTVSGRITDVEGRPLARASVWLFGNSSPNVLGVRSSDRPARTLSTDDDGRFESGKLREGGWFAVLDPSAAAQLDRYVAPTSFTVGSVPAEVALVVAPARWIRGRVVDSAGSGVDGAEVTVTSPRHSGRTGAKTLADGSFVAGPLPDGEFQVEARDAEAARASVRSTIVAGTSDARLVLVPHVGVLRIHVRESAGGALVECAVRIVSEDAHEGFGAGTATTEPLDAHLSPGVRTVVATSVDGRIAVREALVAAERTTDVELVLVPAAELELVHPHGERYAEYELRVGGKLLDVGSVRAGTRRVELVPPGEVAVVRTFGDGTRTTETVVCRAGERARARLP
jgi:hypothetical protein